MLELKKVCKAYGDKSVLKDFNYIFENGIYGLLGANGAGKSTLMNLITDNVKRNSGGRLLCVDRSETKTRTRSRPNRPRTKKEAY